MKPAQSDNQEPVGWFDWDAKQELWVQVYPNTHGQPLYTAPPNKEWVSLTDEEMKQTCYEAWSFDPYAIAQAIQEKLRSKNEH